MDHYKLLGLDKNASKEEIKQAFRKLAIQFHPDKHSQSSKHLRDSATLKFKELSEAYEVLIDDRKRADYNLSRNGYGFADTGRSNGYGYGYGYSGNRGSYGYEYTNRRRGGGVVEKFEIGLKYLTTRSFLLNATFVGVLLGGLYMVDAGGKALWKMHNPGKSFEEAMETIEKTKTREDDSY